MKTCPICHAVAFDDALVCFGCMYRYDLSQEETDRPFADVDESSLFVASAEPDCNPVVIVEEAEESALSSEVADMDDSTLSSGEAPSDGETDEAGVSVAYEMGCCGAPEFVIRMVPVYEQSGAIAWSCSVDVADAQMRA